MTTLTHAQGQRVAELGHWARVLVAVDWDNDGLDISHVTQRMPADSIIAVLSAEQPHWKTGAPQPVHRILFDATQIRDTEVHGIGYRFGFLVTIEQAVA